MSDFSKVLIGFLLGIAGGGMMALAPMPWFVAGLPLAFAGLILIDRVVMR